MKPALVMLLCGCIVPAQAVEEHELEIRRLSGGSVVWEASVRLKDGRFTVKSPATTQSVRVPADASAVEHVPRVVVACLKEMLEVSTVPRDKGDCYEVELEIEQDATGKAISMTITTVQRLTTFDDPYLKGLFVVP